MKDSTNKIKILKTLLESPKTTGEIAIKLEYIDKKGHGKYNVINSDLKTLEQYGFIHRFKSKKSVGAPATTYDIIYELSVIRQIAQKYHLLISDLQKNDKVIKLIYIHLKKLNTYEEFKKKVTLSKKYFEIHLLCDLRRPPQNDEEHIDTLVAMHNTATWFFLQVFDVDLIRYPDTLFYVCVFYDYLTFNSENPYDDLENVMKEYLKK